MKQQVEDIYEALEHVSKMENIPEENARFLSKSFDKRKFKIYENGQLPYELSDAYVKDQK